MVYNLRLILKKSKPPIWYELRVPGGITFSTLSVFLDIASGTKDVLPTDYVFELPSFWVQLREGIFEDDSHPLFKEDLREADTTFIDEYMEKGSWFTYKPDINGDTAFRIEVKNILSDRELFPFTDSCSRRAWELYEQDGRSALKDKLKELMCWQIRYDEDFHFLTKAELLEDRRNKGALPGGQMSAKPDSYVTVPAMASPESRPGNTIRSFARMAEDDLESAIESLGIKGFRTPDMRSLREVLFAIYDETDLRELAEEIGADTDLPGEILALLRKNVREQVVPLLLSIRCADRLLEKECMTERLLFLNDQQMETLKRAVDAGGTFRAAVFSEEDDLARVCALDYAAVTKNENEFLIPTDVMKAFKEIDTPEFQHKRQQHVWLLDCLDVVEHYYGSIPIRQFYRLYRQFGELSREEMTEEIQALDDFETLCTIQDGRIIYRGWLHDDEYKELESYQGDKPYYIPTKKEVEDISWNGYPTQQKEVKTLLAFFLNEMGMEEIDAEILTEEIWHMLNQGGDIHDTMDLVNERKLIFPSDKAMQTFVESITRLNNTTPMLYNRGYSPDALLPLERDRIRRNGLTITPGSTMAAGILAEAADELRAMGVSIDLSSSAREIDTAFVSPNGKTVVNGKKKIYPNDPCPCGSGKKYKNCCGKK